MQSQKRSKKGSKKARISAARLAAAQAVYQAISSEQSFPTVVREYLDHRLAKNLDEEHDMLLPDGNLFQDVVTGVGKRVQDLSDMIQENLQKGKQGSETRPPEPLLMSILLCGAYELMAHHDTDAPIIISDYVDVAHAFYSDSEAGLVNAILDKIKTQIRD